MINRIVSEIRCALNNDLLIIALQAALTLPDICGKAAFPNENTSSRYKKWYDEEIGEYEHAPNYTHMPYLSGKVVYNLRCALLHEGNPNVEKEKTDIDKFTLVLQKSESKCPTACDRGGECKINDNEIVRTYRVNVRRLCTILCLVAEEYYNQNIEKFSFYYRIIDWDEKMKKYPHLADSNSFDLIGSLVPCINGEKTENEQT